jgi:transcriptional regulator with XRE-family HTH domain
MDVLGKMIKSARQERNLTQEQLGRLVGVQKAQISKLESSANSATIDTVLRVFKAMGEEDGIIVKKDGEDIHLTDNNSDNEYLVKLGESTEEMDEDEDMDDEEIEMGESSYGGNKGDISKSRKDYMEEDEDVDAVIEKLFSSDSDNSEGMDFDVEDDEEVMYEIEFDEQDDDDMEDIEMDSDEIEMDEEEMEMDEEEMEMDEQNWEESLDEAYSHKKAPGVKGSGPKFSYNKSAKGGFKEDKKEGPKSVGTGKAKFDYKKGANMEGKSKVVKAETKEEKRKERQEKRQQKRLAKV